MNYTYDDKLGKIEYFKKNTPYVIWLTKLENETFKEFKKNNEITFDEIVKKVYKTNTQIESYYPNVRLNVCRLNKKIKDIGIIRNVRSFGYIYREKSKV